MTRQEKIIKIVVAEKKVEVKNLAERLNVSNVTIRKDLDELESRGIIHREHGYATISNENDLNYRLAINYHQKKSIAEKSAKIVQPGETIMIESGSTCALLAEELAQNLKQITIITNSTFIANYIRKYDSVNTILLGGEYQKDSQVTIGPLTQQAIENFNVDKLFIGVDGFNPKQGFTGSNMNRVNTVKHMMNAANKTIVLTDSSKFEKLGIISAFKFENIHSVYTDKGINKKTVQILTNNNVDVFIAD